MNKHPKRHASLIGAVALTAVALGASALPAAAQPGPGSAGFQKALAKAAAPASATQATSTDSLDAVRGMRSEVGGSHARGLVSDPDYYVMDVHEDGYDSIALPEFIGSALAVPKSSPSTAIALGLTSDYTSGYLTYNGGIVGILVDVNADGDPDYATTTPSYTYMSLDAAYSAPIVKFVNGASVATGHYATWIRSSDSYGTAFDWKALGLEKVQWTIGIVDEYDDADFAPDYFDQVIDLGAGQTAPTAPPAKLTGVSSLRAKQTGTSKVKVTWRVKKGATSYKVRISRPNSKSYRAWSTTYGTSKRWSGLKRGKTYRVQVAPVSNSAGLGPVTTLRFRVR